MQAVKSIVRDIAGIVAGAIETRRFQAPQKPNGRMIWLKQSPLSLRLTPLKGRRARCEELSKVTPALGRV